MGRRTKVGYCFRPSDIRIRNPYSSELVDPFVDLRSVNITLSKAREGQYVLQT